jgi:hypothetical protein
MFGSHAMTNRQCLFGIENIIASSVLMQYS